MTIIDVPVEVPEEMVKEIEAVEKNRTLTLSDALREAHAMGIEQAFCTYIEGENKACAIGAAYLVAHKHGLV